MRSRSSLLAWFATALTAGHTVYAFLIPPTVAFRDNDLARIIAWHLPCAWITTILVLAMGFFGVRALFKPSVRDFARLEATTELAVLFAAMTLLTGILFSRVQWGAFWQWDPRQTSFLFLFFLMAAALALRAGFGDSEKRDQVSAAYAAALTLPALFLIFVFPRLPQVQSFHPKQAGFDSVYWLAITGGLVAYGLWTQVLLVRRIALGVAERTPKSHKEDENDDSNRGNRTSDPVVRPVSL
ncbi:MAG: cytochrome c biogenesis protein CcsA [Fimbriimonadaceae bacterium]|nr:cytochrome c biogenesis protein CcsA [Fimbriimonadaceae bacterium]